MNKTLLLTLAFVAAQLSALAQAATTITVASFPDLDRAAKAALVRWNQAHPDIEVKVVSLQYADHHNAMATALATGSGLPDVMAVDLRYIGKFAEAGGFDDLLLKPYDAAPLRDRFVRYASGKGWWADAFVRNIADGKVKTSAGLDGSGIWTSQYLPPRTWGVNPGVEF